MGVVVVVLEVEGDSELRDGWEFFLRGDLENDDLSLCKAPVSRL